jgi:deoxyribonuclease V
MIIATDVQYDDTNNTAIAAAIAFKDWGDAATVGEWTVEVAGIAPYESGQFYKRELPCLLAVLAVVDVPVDLVVVDGHVWLYGGQPGLGHYLHHAIKKKAPVIGVAKRRFHGSGATEVCRGVSKNPLLVTAVGIEQGIAAAHIRSMHGKFRLPEMLKRVDHLARGRT